MSRSHRIDCLQYCNWSPEIFRQMHDGGVSAVHVTICYHENFRETVANIERWNRRFEQFPDLIFHARTAEDVPSNPKIVDRAAFAPSRQSRGLELHSNGRACRFAPMFESGCTSQ